EDGIRDFHVTGVQTCALPISPPAPGRDRRALLRPGLPRSPARGQRRGRPAAPAAGPGDRDGRGLNPPMSQRLTAQDLFEQQQERLGLRWLAGQQGQSRVLESLDTNARRPSLAGYLNIIYPNKVQILGSEELAWLDGLDSRLRWETIERVIHYRPLALVIGKNQACPEDLRSAA